MYQSILILFACVITLSGPSCLAQETKPNNGQAEKQALQKTIESKAKSSNVLLPSPPVGYHIVRDPLVLKGKFIGFNILLQKEGAISKVFIRVDLRKDVDFAVRGYRSGAIKGYINGMISSITGAGYGIAKKTFPEIEKSDLKEELTSDVEFENKEGDKLFLNQRTFFDQRGFSVSVIADDRDKFKELKAWAAQVRPTKK